MKTFSKLALFITLIFAGSTATFAEDNFSLKVKEDNDKMVSFAITEAQDVALSISSANDGVIFEQKIHAVKPIVKTYNLQEFPDGHYTVKLETALKVTEYNISIEDGKTKISEALIAEKFEPVFAKSKDAIFLEFNNTPQGPIEISILNDSFDKVYEMVFATKALVPKKFKTDKIDAKELTFIVRSKNQEFFKTISLR